MPITLEQAQQILELRDRSFVACDMDAYLSIWAAGCTVEGPTYFLEDREKLRTVIAAAWSVQQPLHMETLGVGVGADTMFSEFALVWQNRSSGERTLQTGATICGVSRSGTWTWLREYFDPASHRRASAAKLPEIHALLSSDSKG